MPSNEEISPSVSDEIKVETDNSDLIDYFIQKEQEEKEQIEQQQLLENEEQQKILQQELIGQEVKENYQLELDEENRQFQKSLLDSVKVITENQSINIEQLIYIKNFNHWLIGINTLMFVVLFCSMISIFLSKQSESR